MMVRVAGDKMAPPIPWMARAAIICGPVAAKPAATLARVKTAMPSR